uniref:Band 7 domain-containing protein n=1 Tax=Amphora coffeiformis TaxID=265554 RepID=A0A7S3LBD5_9STRA|mmetsp:Transcript_12774/g.24547  ORF Transcript_12774/g.24547 Transcript_12774/m.24547 type:complete len:406 (+) Transcript_12774:183-1400(+)
MLPAATSAASTAWRRAGGVRASLVLADKALWNRGSTAATTTATTATSTTTRSMSGWGFDRANPWRWPVTSANTVLNVVPQGHKYVVERFGKLHAVQDSGLFLGIPIVDNIAYVIDMRERALDIPPQSAITRDNVSVEVSGNLFVRFYDAEKAAYGALNPLYSVTQHAQSAMRSAIGEMELDEILHGRARLNSMIRGSLQEAAEPWGLEIRRYEITEITPDQQIRIAMDKQAAAERDRREQVLRAEGAKRKAELESEGVQISLKNESEGNLIKVRNEAEASRSKILLEAEAQAVAIEKLAKAQALALKEIAAELNKAGGEQAAQLALAREYVQMYGEMGKQSNTILFNDRPADVNALLVQAMTAMKVAGDNVHTSKAPQAVLPETNAKPRKESGGSEEGIESGEHK